MTNNLKCPYCGYDMNKCEDRLADVEVAVCRNPACEYDGWHLPIQMIQQIIDGKAAQDALKVADNKVKIAKTALSDIKNICERSQTLTYQEKSAIWADAHGALNGMAIASITTQEKE